MLIRHSKIPLPRHWAGMPGADKALYIGDIGIFRRSRLRMKLMVFGSKPHLRQFWSRTLGHDIGRDCLGVVNNLASEHIAFDRGRERRWLEVDPVYFSVMGLLQDHLTTEIIVHESVHAAFNYAMRMKGRHDWMGVDDLPEEEICYPAGKIAQLVTHVVCEYPKTALD
jgi:hypothetical protein